MDHRSTRTCEPCNDDAMVERGQRGTEPPRIASALQPHYHLIAIDPGKHFCALADFVGGSLRKVTLQPSYTQPSKLLPSNYPHVVLEVPQVYPGPRANDPNDLIDVALAGAWMAARLYPLEPKQFESVYPRVWTKGCPKHLNHKRIYARLTHREHILLQLGLDTVPSDLHHNVIDSVGIGLHALGRLSRWASEPS